VNARFLEALQVAPEAAPDVEPQQGLITRKAEQRRDLLQVIDDIDRHAQHDRRHRSIPAQPPLDAKRKGPRLSARAQINHLEIRMRPYSGSIRQNTIAT
jgi:hypothetical protein